MVLNNVIIQTADGVPVFGRSLACNIGTFCLDISKDSTFDEETILKSGLFTAMLTFNEAETDTFHELPMAEAKVLSFPTKNVIGVFEVGADDDSEKLKQRLRVMVDLFEDNYKEEIRNFDGDISKFEDFENILSNHGILEEGEKFKKNCLDCTYSKSCTFRVVTKPRYPTVGEKLRSIKGIGLMKKAILMMRGMPRMILNVIY